MNHRHILVTARGLACPPTDPETVTRWLDRLVEAVGMKVLMGPYAQRCDTPGNEGVTGAVVIETSHATMHCWDTVEVPFLQLDLYSCADFSSRTVVDLLAEFGPAEIEWILVDRNGAPELVEAGHYTP